MYNNTSSTAVYKLFHYLINKVNVRSSRNYNSVTFKKRISFFIYCTSILLTTIHLTDNKDFVDWARPMIYMGRNRDIKYVDDKLMASGYNMYMTPETAELGLFNFNDRINFGFDDKDIADNNHYKDISNLDWYDD